MKLIRGLGSARAIALLALVIAIGTGTAWALKPNSVRSRTIVDGQVKEADLATAERAKPVGEPGNAEFSTGGDGDCGWSNIDGSALGFDIAPVSYGKDPFGYVHLNGVARTLEGQPPSCGGDLEDLFIFRLPAAYRPAGVNVLTATGSVGPDRKPVDVVVVGREDVTTSPGLGSVTLPAGTVMFFEPLDDDYNDINLTSQSFRAGGGAGSARQASSVSTGELEGLLSGDPLGE